MNLPTYLKIARENMKLTQKQVASQLGFTSGQFVNNWEGGKSKPPINLLKKISKLYHIDATDIFNYILNDEMNQLQTKLRFKFENSKE